MERKKRVSACTLGCKVNQYETDAMLELLANAQYEIVDFKKPADVCIINTCSVTNMADRKSRQMIHRAKKKNPDCIVVAAGCYVQAMKEASDFQIDIILGNNRKKEIVSVLDAYEKDKGRKTELIDINHTNEYEVLSLSKVKEHTRAYLKIQDGCNQFCSYCIIPFTRGRVRSNQPENVIKEVKALVENGFKEIVLTGIHLSSYGKDLGNTSLLEIIMDLSKIEGLERIRLGSLEPGIITEQFVKTLSENPKFCPHFHLSLQSGCDETLKRMNRKYTTKEYMQKCDLIRRYFEAPALTTDVIVGFPGETEEEFEATKKFLKEVAFYEMHIFKYSKREGTRAVSMPNQVDESIKHIRSEQLIEITKKQKKEYEDSFLGKEEEVLVEEPIEIDGTTYYTGHTKRYVKVAFAGNDVESNQIITLKIEKRIQDDMLQGKV